MHLPPTSHPRQGTWELETACSVLGRVPWGPVVHPNRPPSMLTPLGTWVPENGDLKLSGPTLPCQGPPTPAGDGSYPLGCPKPHQPCYPSPGASPHSSLLLAPSGALSVASQQLPGPLPQAAGREGTGPVRAARAAPQIPTLGSSWLIRGGRGFVGSATRISN